MDKNQSERLLQVVVNALKKAGYDPCDQLKGYLQTRNVTYITRLDGARDIISQISLDCIKEYLDAMERRS